VLPCGDDADGGWRLSPSDVTREENVARRRKIQPVRVALRWLCFIRVPDKYIRFLYYLTTTNTMECLLPSCSCSILLN